MIESTIQDNAKLEIVRHAREQLRQASVISYEHEAEMLLCHVLGVTRIELYAGYLDINLLDKERFKDLIQKRVSGTPLQYIVGKTEFFGLPFFVSPGIFIPRPETEILVETLLAVSGEHILDLCTGTGCIAICLAKYIKCDKIVATDISEKAIEIAKTNAGINGIASYIEFRKGDLFGCISPKEKFDIIVSNPPYIKHSDLTFLPKDVMREPINALDGGIDGIDFYRRIIVEAPDFLKEGGILAMEIGDGQAGAIEQICKDIFKSVEFVRDYNGIERVCILK